MIAANELNPSELRIGNLVYHKDNPLPQKVDGLDLHKIQTEYISEYAMPDCFFGVPLSPEWLTRAGLKPNSDKSIWDLQESLEINVRQYDSGWIPGQSTFSIWIGDMYLRDCEHLHTLQNVIFALTGQELRFILA